eukprot:NODE_340_length_2069_cov_63.391349_g334_i0.p1 GENE.NODE_340_length_2069_cov_63.391349_g334_i0~~NODE_340_length_2069_cov_63.391349_g334_i0.p1  ORF type:complete len:634 (+),score=119.15 NODE_340_length_2069_cov_63.391349_g334_i0:132-2033(+)
MAPKPDEEKDVAKDVEKMIEKLSATPTRSNISQMSPKKSRKTEIEDCLDAADKSGYSVPSYAARKASPSKKGVVFGAPASGKRYVSAALDAHLYLGTHSPGPGYTPVSFTDSPSPQGKSFAKASRHTKKEENVSPGPQKYEIPGTIGRQLTRASAPSFKMGQCARFRESEFISRGHSKQLISKDSPGPNAYSPEDTSHSPQFSFTSGREVKPGKLFVSKEHSQHDAFGVNSPGPMYSWNPNLIYPKEPAYSFGTSDRPADRVSQRPSSTPPDTAAAAAEQEARKTGKLIPGAKGEDSPGPGNYDIDACTKPMGPSFTFGTPDSRGANRFLGRGHVGMGGHSNSPGPRYNPCEKQTKKNAPACQFATPDPLLGSMQQRFSQKQFVSQDLSYADFAGRSSPGPAAYEQEKASHAPAFTMARREKILLKRVCPAPERARFISKELSKENKGAYSPGPKYKPVDTIGQPGSKAYSFGHSDRQFDEADKEGRARDTPYTAPSEARYLSKEQQAHSMLGKCSPGPKYNPDYTQIEKQQPAHKFPSKKPEKNTKPTKEEYDETRKRIIKQGKKDPTAKVAPAFTIGPNNPKDRREAAKKGEGEKYGKTFVPGRDSPGPVYKPNFAAVDKKMGAVSFGGLS